ncbi:MAG: hypothetical protein ACI8ZB_002239 [Desulforhopalus sp.]|jgi:hypothetical protein
MTTFARTCNIVITVVEVVACGALVILELLSGYKAGVMQHLYHKKVQYLSTLYNQDYLLFHFLFFLLCALFLAFRLYGLQFSAIVRRLLPFTLISLFLALCYLSPFAKELNIYAHLLIYLEYCLVFETLRAYFLK